jgi:hypothetical protein
MQSVILGAIVVLGLVLSPLGGALAQTETWNQEKVTALSGELVQAVSGLRDAVRKSPMRDNPQQKRIFYRISDYLRRIESESLSLRAQLTKGAGMEETWPNYRNIRLLRRNAEVLAKKTDVSAPTQPKLDRAEQLLDEISGYYPPEPTPDPRT